MVFNKCLSKENEKKRVSACQKCFAKQSFVSMRLLARGVGSTLLCFTRAESQSLCGQAATAEAGLGYCGASKSDTTEFQEGVETSSPHLCLFGVGLKNGGGRHFGPSVRGRRTLQGKRSSSLFGYVPFLQNDLPLPGGQLGLIVAHGP